MTIDEQITCQIDRELTNTHATALDALDHDQVGRFDAVVWLSAHLMAAEHALLPAIRRYVPTSTPVVEEHRQADRRLHRALRALEQISAGDTHATDLDERVVRQEVAQCLDAHIATEHVLLDLLSPVLTVDEDCELTDHYRQLLAHGATRPHPHAPSRGPLAGLVFRFDRVRDHILDVLDSRSTPLARPSTALVRPGRWGNYVLGRMEPAPPGRAPTTPAN